MIRRIDHVSVLARDYAATARFYQDVLGFTLFAEKTLGGAKERHISYLRPPAGDAALVLERLTDSDDVTRIEFHMPESPALHGGGYLSGLHAQPDADDSFQWAELADPGLDETVMLTSTPATTRRPRATSRALPTLLTIAGAVGVAATFAVLLAIKLFK